MAITSPLAEYLIEHTGWPSAFLGLAALPLVVGVPLALLVLRAAPADARGSAAAAPPPGMTCREAMRSRTFWTLLAVFLLFAAAMNGIEIHIVALLGDRGFPAMVAALVLSLINVVAIGARIGAGYLFDRLFAPQVAALLFAAPLVSTLLLLGSHAPFAAYAAAVLYGFGIGAESDLLAYLIGRYFGLRAYGELFGWIFGAFMVGTAVGPTLFGLAYDHDGSYALPLTVSLFVFAVVCLLLLSMPKYPRDAALP
jgi:predicted MFS family arabinose efflux permease